MADTWKPKFSKGQYVYYRRYAESSLTGEKMPLNRVFFYVNEVRVNEVGWRYQVCNTGIWIEEDNLKSGDVLDRMIDEDEWGPE